MVNKVLTYAYNLNVIFLLKVFQFTNRDSKSSFVVPTAYYSYALNSKLGGGRVVFENEMACCLLYMESWAAPVRVPTKGHLHRVSRQSCLSANDKGVNEMILGAVQRSPRALKLRKTLEISARRQSYDDWATCHRVNWGPLPTNEVDRIAQHFRKEEVKDGGLDQNDMNLMNVE